MILKAMSTHRYKNNTDNDLVIIGVGVVEAGKTIESEEAIDNPNLTEVAAKSVKKSVNKDEGDAN